MIPAIPCIFEVSDMTEELKFFVYLIECYACAKGRSTGDVMREWDEHGITQEIYEELCKE